MKKQKQMSETFLICSILAIVGGFLDAYTYICRGGVFANAETGNIVLMGIKLAGGEIKGALFYLIPIFFFALGVLLCEKIRQLFKKSKHIHWRQIIIAFEIIVLVIIAFVPSTHTSNIFTNALISFVCSLQVQSFRKVNGHSIATTMCTGNLRSGTEYLFSYITGKDKAQLAKALHYFGIIAFFVLGAAIGAVITIQLNIKAVLVACAGLAAVFLIMFVDKEGNKIVQ